MERERVLPKAITRTFRLPLIGDYRCIRSRRRPRRVTDLSSIKRMSKAEARRFLFQGTAPLQIFLVTFILAVASVFFWPDRWISSLVVSTDFWGSPFGRLVDCVPRTGLQDRMLSARIVGGAVSAAAAVGALLYAFWPWRSVPEAKPLPLRGWVFLGFWLLSPFIMVASKRSPQGACVELLQTPGHLVMGIVAICVAAVMIHLTLLNLKRI